jgi:2''-5'' RNA ligase
VFGSTVRGFSAIEVSGGLADELLRVREAVDIGFSPVRKQDFHITLQFFENLGMEDAERIAESARKADTEPFEAEVRGLGAFPSEEHIRVVWADVLGQEMFDLKNTVSDHRVEEDNSHEFHPHITLLRVSEAAPRQRRKLRRSLEEFGDHHFGTLEVDRLKVFESDDGYREIETVRL